MANPLILSTRRNERMVQLGREKRQRDRKNEADVIITEAIKILGHHLPRMMEEPPYADRFEQLWPKVDEQLRQVLKTRDAYLLAYRFLCQRLEQGNREGIWQIDTPPPYLTLRRKRPFRTETWHKATIEMGSTIEHWRSYLSAPTKDADQLFARLLLCGIAYGGLNRPALWVPLGQTLLDLTPLHGNAELTWLTLRLEPGEFPSNCYCRNSALDDAEENGADPIRKAVTEVHYVPDPISLGILYQFLKCRQPDWHPPTTMKECQAILATELGKNHSLRELCRGAIGLTEHLSGIELPQVLLEYAVGRTHSASLPQEYWYRLQYPQLFPASQDRYAKFYIPESSTNSGSSKRLPSSKAPYLLEELRAVFRKDLAAPKTKSAIISELQELLQNKTQTLSEQVLVSWLLSLIEERQRAVSTASRYLESIGKDWLSVTLQVPLDTYNGTDFFELYDNMLNRPWSQKTRDYMAGRFQDMHTFAVQDFYFAQLDGSLTTSEKGTPHVHAAIVDEPLFSGLLGQIDCFTDADYALREMIKCVLIIAYRTGLRPGEIAKLRLIDAEPSAIGWMFVRSNRHGHNKTDAALRKVPLYPLLTAAENELIKHYMGEQRLKAASNAELIFHAPGNPHEQLNMRQLSQMVKSVLRQLSGGLFYRLYDLRHSCLSRMQLLLHSDLVQLPDFIQQAMLPYSEAEKTEILRIVTGDHKRIRDRYMALAVMAGHSSPDITLNNYLHFTDLLLGLHLSSNRTPLSKQESCFLFGLSTRKYCRLEPDGEQKTSLTPEKLKPFLSTKLREYRTKFTSKRPFGDQAKTLADFDRVSHFEQSEAALKLIEKGHELQNIASQFGVSEKQIEDWQATAIALRHLKTSKGHSRLFTQVRQYKLLPAELGTTVEKHQLRDALKVCQGMRFNRKQMHEFKWAIQYCLTHLNSSHGGIKFTEPKAFRRFMAITSKLFPEFQWHLALHVPTDKPAKRWYIHPLLIVERTDLRKINQFPKGYGELTLQHPKEEMRLKHHSSPLLRYLFHRFAIILFKASHVRGWQTDDPAAFLRLVIESRDKLLEDLLIPD
jgi:integrase